MRLIGHVILGLVTLVLQEKRSKNSSNSYIKKESTDKAEEKEKSLHFCLQMKKR